MVKIAQGPRNAVAPEGLENLSEDERKAFMRQTARHGGGRIVSDQATVPQKVHQDKVRELEGEISSLRSKVEELKTERNQIREERDSYRDRFERKLEELKSIVLMGFDAECMTFTEKVRRVMETHFDFLVQHPGLPRFVLNEIMPKPALFKELKNKINGLMDKSMLAMLAAELNGAIERGEVSSISIYDLILDIVSVNIMTFIALPTVKVILGEEMAESAYLEARRRENVELIIRRLAR